MAPRFASSDPIPRHVANDLIWTAEGQVVIGNTSVTQTVINGAAVATTTVRLKGYTVSGLSAITAVQGDTAFVTDAVVPTFLGALTGGGAIVTPVFYNGSAWVSY